MQPNISNNDVNSSHWRLVIVVMIIHPPRKIAKFNSKSCTGATLWHTLVSLKKKKKSGTQELSGELLSFCPREQQNFRRCNTRLNKTKRQRAKDCEKGCEKGWPRRHLAQGRTRANWLWGVRSNSLSQSPECPTSRLLQGVLGRRVIGWLSANCWKKDNGSIKTVLIDPESERARVYFTVPAALIDVDRRSNLRRK